MEDKKIGLLDTIAWIGWTVGSLLVFAESLAPAHGATGRLGILVVTAAATIHVRAFLCTYTAGYREAYRIGREVGRGEAAEGGIPVQRIH